MGRVDTRQGRSASHLCGLGTSKAPLSHTSFSTTTPRCGDCHLVPTPLIVVGCQQQPCETGYLAQVGDTEKAR